MRAEAAAAAAADWRSALDAVAERLPMLRDGTPVDLVLLFASDEYAASYPELLADVQGRTGARLLVGCSGQGVIGPGREIEGEPALSLIAFSLPGADLKALRLRQADIEDDATAAMCLERAAIGDLNAWLLFADPYTLDPERLLVALSHAYPSAPLVGGLASGDPRRRRTELFLDGEVIAEGAVALAIGGPYDVCTVVSQGCVPIGEAWTITGATENVVETIGMRPARDVLMETFEALPQETQARARSNLLVGLAMDEYRDDFGRGDFLIRSLMGIDDRQGTILVGAEPRVGQTIQFQLRDPAAADEDLVALLGEARDALGGRQPVGALLCACNGRGVGLFGAPDHDALAMIEQLGPVPVAGLFCNGEIGPIGGKPFLHGFTASIALIVPREAPA